MDKRKKKPAAKTSTGSKPLTDYKARDAAGTTNQADAAFQRVAGKAKAATPKG